MHVDARARTGRMAGRLGILTLILGTLAACTGGGVATSPSAASASPSASASESASASASESASASASGAAGTSQELAIEAADYKFGAPSSIAAGPTHIVVNNVGKEDHQAQVAKIADDKTSRT